MAFRFNNLSESITPVNFHDTGFYLTRKRALRFCHFSLKKALLVRYVTKKVLSSFPLPTPGLQEIGK
jgi:hypothetical protein